MQRMNMKEVHIITNFERVNGFPVMKSKMGDKLIGMLLDTGSKECILDSSFYKEFGGKPEMILPAEPLYSPSGNMETTGKTLIDLTIGSNVMRIPVALADIRKYLSVIADELDCPIVGLLGSKFFHRYKMHIDFDNEMIYSYEPVTKRDSIKKSIIGEKDTLRNLGFEGFISIGELMDGAKSEIPAQTGVYVVLRESNTTPKFLVEGTGGFFKGKNPNVSIDELEANWVDGTSIVYIGKAGSMGSTANLRTRLGQYLRFGEGANVGHWGGRYIWQLEDSRDLIVCWKLLTSEYPRTIEQQMISEFKDAHFGRRPFANATGTGT